MKLKNENSPQIDLQSPAVSTGGGSRLGRGITVNGEITGREDLTIEGHCQGKISLKDNTLIVERRRAARYKSAAELPIGIIESLMSAHRHWLHRLCTQFLVCTHSKLPTLLDAIKQAAESAIKSREEL